MRLKDYHAHRKTQTKPTISNKIIISKQQSFVFYSSLSILLFVRKIYWFPLSRFLSRFTNKGFYWSNSSPIPTATVFITPT